MTEKNNHEKNLFYLHDLPDYKVADDYCDVRGWYMKDSSGRTIGKVEGLLVNKKEERVVYLDVEVNEEIIAKGHETFAAKASEGIHEFLNNDGETHLIVPIGLAVIDEENKIVKSDKINYETFSKTHRYKKGTDVQREYELIVFKDYLPVKFENKSTLNETDFYNDDAFSSPKSRK